MVAWFTLAYPVKPADAMGAYGTLASRKSGDTWTHCWDNLCTEFADVFEPLSIPQEYKLITRSNSY